MIATVLLGLAACEAPYESQIGAVPGPDEVAAPDPSAQARWTTTHLGGAELRAVTCLPGGGAVAVGPGAAVARVDAQGQAALAPSAPSDLGAVLATPERLLAAGPEILYDCPLDSLTAAACRATPLPRAGVLPRGLATGPGDVLWVAGRAPRGATTVGWVARRRAGAWIERTVDDVAAVTQVLPHEDGALLVVEATPYLWTPPASSSASPAVSPASPAPAAAPAPTSAGHLDYFMPAQPDAHPPIAALARTARGFVAVGPDNAWRLERRTLVRELRQLYLRLEAVAALPDGRAIAVGRDDPPGGRAGGLVLGRDARGRWRRELLVPGTPLHAVARCGARSIAVGEGGLVAIRRD